VRATAGRREKVAGTEQKHGAANPGAIVSKGSPNSFGVAGGQRYGHGNSKEEERWQEESCTEDEDCFEDEGRSEEESCFEEENCFEEEDCFEDESRSQADAGSRNGEAEQRGEGTEFRDRLQRYPERAAVFDMQSPALKIRRESFEQ
jgi:hypothetical protein